MNQGIIHIKAGCTSIVLPLSPKFSFHYHFQLHHIPCHHWNVAASFQNPRRQKRRRRKREGIRDTMSERERGREDRKMKRKRVGPMEKSWKEEKGWQD
jgi:hypothetical protein